MDEIFQHLHLDHSHSAFSLLVGGSHHQGDDFFQNLLGILTVLHGVLVELVSLFGICLFASEFKIRYVLKKVPFLKNMLGRGLFYLYLSSVIYYYFDNNQDTLMAWISALTLFISGVVYIAIHFGYAKDLKREDLEEQYEETYKERLV